MWLLFTSLPSCDSLTAQVITTNLMQEVVQELPVLITENDLHVSQVCVYVCTYIHSMFLMTHMVSPSQLAGTAVFIINDGDMSCGCCEECGCGLTCSILLLPSLVIRWWTH